MTLTKIIVAIKNWNTYNQIQFLEKTTHLLTIALRDICEKKNATDKQKLEAIKWLNEFQQRILVNIMNVNNRVAEDELDGLEKNMLFYGNQNITTKNSIHWVITKAYEHTKDKSSNLAITPKRQHIILNALNEVRSAAYAIDIEKFQNLMGAEKLEVLQLWKDLNNSWVDTYEIRKGTSADCIEHTLVKFDHPMKKNEEVLFSFEAKNYIRASEIYNRFLDFEPYASMPEDVVSTRTFDLINPTNQKIKEVVLTVYKPIKNNESEWSCSYQISEIKNNTPFSILGIDALQSFELALYIINGLLQDYNRENDNQIVWNGEATHLIYTIK